jgi:hypothetical protein
MMIERKLFPGLRNPWRILFIGVAVALLFACTTGNSADTADNKQQTGTISPTVSATVPALSAGRPCALEIFPHEVTCGSVLTLIPKGFVVSEAKIVWLINGNPVMSSVPQQLRVSDFIEIKKGASIQAKAIFAGREILSDIVKVGNAPPEVKSVKLLPEVFSPGDKLHVEVSGKDIDSDAVTCMYQWSRNGAPAGTGDSLDALIKRGDKITVKITPFDGEVCGDPVVLEREVRNLPPVITAHNEYSFNGTVYTYQVKASDPDEDALVYLLEGAPDGMSIDKSAGLITWKVPAEFKGDAGATAVVNDGNGGIARYNMKISIK